MAAGILGIFVGAGNIGGKGDDLVAAVEMTEYSFAYAGGTEPVLKKISLKVEAGSLVLLCGATGSGKTTLLRSMKPELRPAGTVSGMLQMGTEQIGYVAQSPESQLVMDTVRHELAFGLENLGLEPQVIRRRMAETAHFFGIAPWLGKKVSQLSGGQKQLLNLASVVAMQPELLLLDEPTAQLDPIAAREFLQMVQRLRRELGMTVIICEHRLEEILPEAELVLWMEDGRILCRKTPKEWAAWMLQERPEHGVMLPAPLRIWNDCETEKYRGCPLSVGEGRRWLLDCRADGKAFHCALRECPSKGKKSTALAVQNLWFSYQRRGEMVLEEVNLEIFSGEIHAILGGNGSGKSTLLQLLAGVLHPQRGRRLLAKNLRTGLLTQNPQAMMTADSVREELEELSESFHYGQKEIQEMLERLRLAHLAERHPYDLSGGEQQKTALAKLLLLQPDILLLDEPSKGLDGEARQELKRILLELKQEGKTIVLVTHDTEFAAELSDRCSMLADGSIVCTDGGRAFFAQNLFYTTQTNRMMRGVAKECILPEDVICV